LFRQFAFIAYVIELFDIGEGTIVSVEATDEKSRGEVAPTWLPDGYKLERDRREANLIMMYFSNGQNLITFTAHSDVSMGNYTIDTENANNTCSTKILDNDAILVEKGQEVYLYWFEDNTAYQLWGDIAGKETLVKIAKSCYGE